MCLRISIPKSTSHELNQTTQPQPALLIVLGRSVIPLQVRGPRSHSRTMAILHDHLKRLIL